MSTKMTTRFLILIFVNLLFLGCQESTEDDGLPYEGPPKGHIISVERAQEMYDTYSKRRVPIIQAYEDSIPLKDTEKFQPTRAVEFDLATIKQYIAYIEHESKQANVDIKTLRFYLSNYPDSTKFSNGSAVKYPRKNSIMVVPTMDYEGGNVGFSILEMDGKYTAIPINQKITKRDDKRENDGLGQSNEAGFFTAISATVQVGSTSLILNEGTSMPPPGKDDFGGNN